MARISRAGLGLALCVAVGAVAAAPTGAQSQCTAAKLKAGGAFAGTLSKCVSKSLATGSAIDPLCVAKAQTKLASSFAKAEKKSDCPNLGDLTPVQDVLEDAVPNALEILDPPAPTCCDLGTAICVLTADGADCTGLGGTPGAAGTECDGIVGSCVAAGTADVGSCCTGIPLPPEVVSECAMGFGLNMSCEGSGFGTLTEGSCHPARGCVAPGDETTSRCSAAKMKAAGKYFVAVAKCEAKGAAKGTGPDLVCLGKAQSKLLKAFEKAEGGDDCEALGEVEPARNQIDDDLALLFSILEAPPSVCCDAGPVCLFTPDADACTANGGTPGAAGSVCNAPTGDCAPAPSADGNCCENITFGTLDGLCAAGTSTQIQCQNSGGTFVPDAVCLPAQVCIE